MLNEGRFTCLNRAVRKDFSEQVNYLNKDLMKSGEGA